MGDNVLIDPGSTEAVGADEITDLTLGVVKVQYVKLMDGTLNGTSKAYVGIHGLSTGHNKTLASKTGSASATFTLVAAVTSKKIKVYSLSLMTDSTSAVTVTFNDGAGGTTLGTYILQAISGTNFGIVENVKVPDVLFMTSAGALLEMAFSASVSVTYNVRYWADDAT